jgi:hypothetical protein
VEAGDVRERIAGTDGCHLCQASPDELASGLYNVYVGPRSIDGRRLVEELALANTSDQILDFYKATVERFKDQKGA